MSLSWWITLHASLLHFAPMKENSGMGGAAVWAKLR